MSPHPSAAAVAPARPSAPAPGLDGPPAATILPQSRLAVAEPERPCRAIHPDAPGRARRPVSCSGRGTWTTSSGSLPTTTTGSALTHASLVTGRPLDQRRRRCAAYHRRVVSGARNALGVFSSTTDGSHDADGVLEHHGPARYRTLLIASITVVRAFWQPDASNLATTPDSNRTAA